MTKQKAQEQEEQASVTLQMPKRLKVAHERLAYEVGLRQLRNGKEQGNLSAILKLQAEYVNEDAEAFGEWLKRRVIAAMDKKE
jgi:hypothetical protein